MNECESIGYTQQNKNANQLHDKTKENDSSLNENKIKTLRRPKLNESTIDMLGCSQTKENKTTLTGQSQSSINEMGTLSYDSSGKDKAEGYKQSNKMENQNPYQEYSNVQQNNSIGCEANEIETECEESHIFTDSNTESVHYVNHACYYVQGKVDQVRLNFLVDSGSSICVLSEKVFEKICKDTVTLQETDRKVRTANGNLLKLKGVCTLQIQLDHLVFDQEFIVANTEEPGILGISFLEQFEIDIKIKKESSENKGISFHEQFEVDIKIKKKVLETNMGKIKQHKQSQEQCCRVQLCESVTVPPHSETFVKTYTSQNCLDQLNIVEPSNKQLHQGLLVAKTLVDTAQAQMVVSVLNVGSKSVKLRENTTLGTIHPRPVPDPD